MIPLKATDAEAELLERIPSKADPLEHRDTVFRELADQISTRAATCAVPCQRAGCDAKVKWLTLGRGSVCAWCRSHGAGFNDNLRCIPAAQFFDGPFGTLDHLLERAGRQSVKALVLFCIRHDLISLDTEAPTHQR